MKITVKLPDDIFNIDTLNGPIEDVIERLTDIKELSELENIWIKVNDAWGVLTVSAEGKREATEKEMKELSEQQTKDAEFLEVRERKELARLKAKYDPEPTFKELNKEYNG